MNSRAEELNRRLEQGKSGYSLIALPNNTVRKVCYEGGELERRLRAQCNKQRTFALSLDGLRVCPVLGEGHTENHYWFEMPLIRADSFVSFADKASVDRINHFGRKILRLVGDFLASSPVQPVATELISAKSVHTYSKVKPGRMPAPLVAAYIAHLNELEALGPLVDLPIGKCHGDLTFSNLLFSPDGELVLIDFLDVYIESPVLDMVKVLQETSLSWSRLVSREAFDSTKANILAAHLDRFFRREFAKFSFFERLGRIMEFQNLLRLVPYLPDGDILRSVFQQMLTISRRPSDEISVARSR